MAKFKLTLKGNKAVLKGLDKYKNQTIEKVGDEIQTSGITIRQQASIKVQSGITDNGTLEKLLTEQYEPSKLTSRVEAGAHYSPYVEFGTGGLVDVPEGLEEYAMQFKGKNIRQVNLPPRPFLWPALEAEKPKLIENIKKVLNQSK